MKLRVFLSCILLQNVYWAQTCDAWVPHKDILPRQSHQQLQPLQRDDNSRLKPSRKENKFQTLRASSDSSAESTASSSPRRYQHVMAILAMPFSSVDRIANEQIIHAILPQTDKLSIVLRCESSMAPSLARLRRYMGEVYSQIWDCVMYNDDHASNAQQLPDVVVYPQNLPNTAPESWLEIQKDLDGVCSQDTVTGWISEGADGRGLLFQTQDGVGGLEEHVRAINRERKQRDLAPVAAISVPHVPAWLQPQDESVNEVVFVDDDPEDNRASPLGRALRAQLSVASGTYCEDDEDECDASANQSFLGGAKIPTNQYLYDSVCVGGTFDSLHFGHRKLLTLAVSSVIPVTGRLLVGVTVDEMLQNKQFAEYMPTWDERCEGVRQFLHRLAPGMMNRVQIVPLSDPYGPPCSSDSKQNQFDALVLSHETLPTGHSMNQYRVEKLGLPPMKLLCTRRTEAQGMSSTALRRMRAERENNKRGPPVAR